MQVLLTLLIVAIPQAASIEAARPADAPLFSCSFDQSWDKDYEGWPDGWTRRRGPGFPRYVGIQISRQPTPTDDTCLRIELNGGGAVAYSPPIPVGTRFGYVMDCQLSTEGLTHDRAFLSITLMDGKRRPIETFTSEKLHQTGGWKRVRLGPIATDSPDVETAVLGLHLEPSAKADLTGTACFDDVRLYRVPRMAVSLCSPGQAPGRHIFTDSNGISVRFDASGFRDPASGVTFQLFDVEGRTLAVSDGIALGLTAETVFAEAVAAETGDPLADERPILSASAEWLPPIPGPGFYRLRAEMAAPDGTPLGSVETTLAVIEPAGRPWLSEFGWTMPDDRQPYTLDELVPLLDQLGVGRLKYPLWLDVDAEPGDFERLVHFSRQLTAQGIELVGLLADPPFRVPDQIDPRKPPTAAEIFTAPAEVWQPSLETVIERVCSGVRRWQLGVDTDTSFVGYPDLSQKIAEIKSQLDTADASLELGLSWKWSEGLPAPVGRSSRPAKNPPDSATSTTAAQDAPPSLPWEFVSLCGNPPPDAVSEAQSSLAERWVALDTLDRSYPASARAADLVRRIVEAKRCGVQGIFMPQVFDSEHGLFDANGLPNDLLLPWHTSAVLLGGTEPMGCIAMPGGSTNWLFREGNRVVMVAWNDTPTEETLYLGGDLRQLDPWGRELPVSAEGDRQQFVLGQLPTFLVGIDRRAVQWRQGFRLGTARLSSVFGEPHSTEFQITNPLNQPAWGTLTLQAPKGWRLEPSRIRIELAAGETLHQPLTITLPFDTTAGRHEIRAEFRVKEGGRAGDWQPEEDDDGLSEASLPASRRLAFCAYRSLDVGLDDVDVVVTTRLAPSGDLEVRQRLVNRGQEPISFRFTLFAPERRAMRSEIVGQPPGGAVKTYRLADGAALVGKSLWLRGEDLDRDRSLNYRIVAKP